MSTIHEFIVAALGGSGPKSTAINFVKTDDGVRVWTWVDNATAAKVRPGMVVQAEQASFGKVETTYTDKAGNVVTLQVPKQQVFLGGQVIVTKPKSETLTPATIVIDDEAEEYARAYDAKNARPTIVVSDNSEGPF